MNKWKHRFDFAGFYHNDEVPVPEKGKRIAEILRDRLLPMFDPDEDLSEYCEIEDLIEEFACVADAEEFDFAMTTLYDIADYQRIWIATHKHM